MARDNKRRCVDGHEPERDRGGQKPRSHGHEALLHVPWRLILGAELTRASSVRLHWDLDGYVPRYRTSLVDPVPVRYASVNRSSHERGSRPLAGVWLLRRRVTFEGPLCPVWRLAGLLSCSVPAG